MDIRVSEIQTNMLKDELEERMYGERLTSMELASKASVSLDDVNRFERHLPIADSAILIRLAEALGITTDLYDKIAGSDEISTEELRQVEQCIMDSKSSGTTSAECQRLGLRPVLH